MRKICQHLQTFELHKPDKDYCEECVKTGSSWLHLRVCQTCGVTLCCDSSPNKHASKHAAHANHPVIISGEPDEYWAYCFVDDQAADLEPY